MVPYETIIIIEIPLLCTIIVVVCRCTLIFITHSEREYECPRELDQQLQILLMRCDAFDEKNGPVTSL